MLSLVQNDVLMVAEILSSNRIEFHWLSKHKIRAPRRNRAHFERTYVAIWQRVVVVVVFVGYKSAQARGVGRSSFESIFFPTRRGIFKIRIIDISRIPNTAREHLLHWLIFFTPFLTPAARQGAEQWNRKFFFPTKPALTIKVRFPNLIFY